METNVWKSWDMVWAWSQEHWPSKVTGLLGLERTGALLSIGCLRPKEATASLAPTFRKASVAPMPTPLQMQWERYDLPGPYPSSNGLHKVYPPTHTALDIRKHIDQSELPGSHNMNHILLMHDPQEIRAWQNGIEVTFYLEDIHPPMAKKRPNSVRT